MTYTEHKITLDIHKTVSPVSLSVKKGDTARRLLIHLAEKGRPYHIDDGCYAVFTALKPDGNVVFNNCSIDKCVIIYDFTEQTVAAAGLVNCEIILYGSNGKQLTSASFTIIVEDTIYDAETEVESTSEYNALADLIAKVQAIYGNGPLAPAVVRAAEGEQISLTDASNQVLQGLRIFGKSIQEGTPTRDNPVEIVNVGTAGEVRVSVAGQNLLDASAITAPSQNTAVQITESGNIIKLYATGETHTYARAEVAMEHLVGRKFYVGYDKKTNYGTDVDGYLQIRYNLAGTLKYIENGAMLAGMSEIPAEAHDVVLAIYFRNAAVTIASGAYVQYEGLRITLVNGDAWEPYQEIQQLSISTPDGLAGIPVASGGNNRQWICDEVDLGRGVYVQRIGIRVFDGVNYPFKATAVAHVYSACYVDTSEYFASYECNNALSTMYTFAVIDISSGALTKDKTFMLYRHIESSVTMTGIMIYDTAFADVEEVNAFFAEHPLQVMYALRTPIETRLTEEEIAAFAALHTYKPNTTIYNDAGAFMAAEYVADTQTYVEQMVSGAVPVVGAVTLPANKWVGEDSPYSQVVELAGVTENSLVDLEPSVEQLAIFHDKDLAFVTENEGGVVTVYAVGDKPTNDYTIQVSITEVSV